MQTNRVALVTGASRGIGRATADCLVKKGYTVYGISRKPCDLGPVRHIQADVTVPAQLEKAVKQIVSETGRIDLLISNAGIGISGAVEFTQPEEAHRQMEVNFFGFYNCARAVLPYMRAQGSGMILALSSVAAVFAIPFQTFYSASKAAVSVFAAGLANEVRPFSIRVAAIMPGDTSTGFTAAREKNNVGNDIYGGKLAESVAIMEHDEQTGMSSAYVAKKICRIAEKKRPSPLYTIGNKYKVLLFLNRFLPAKLVQRVIRWLYEK